jgi:hypothetical protein
MFRNRNWDHLDERLYFIKKYPSAISSLFLISDSYKYDTRGFWSPKLMKRLGKPPD